METAAPAGLMNRKPGYFIEAYGEQEKWPQGEKVATCTYNRRLALSQINYPLYKGS